MQSLWAGVWLFRDAGWYPDFPTSSRAMEQFFKLGQGISVDGVISLDQWAVQTILDAIGPIMLFPGEVLDSDSYIRILEEKTDELGREYMDSVLGALLDRLREQGGERDLVVLPSAINRSLVEKHILLFFHDPALREVASSNGWGGALKQGPGDYLMVVDSNVGFSKVNRNITQRILYTVDIRAEGEAKARLDILYTNQSSELTPNSCAIQASDRAGITYQQLKNTCYWNYLRVYVPGDSVFTTSSTLPMPQGALYRRIGYNDIEDTIRTYTESNKAVIAGLFNLEVRESRTVAFVYTLPPGVVQRDGGRLTYSLYLQKQPGTGSIPVEVNLHLPAGYTVNGANPAPSSIGAQNVQFNISLDSDTGIELTLKRR